MQMRFGSGMLEGIVRDSGKPEVSATCCLLVPKSENYSKGIVQRFLSKISRGLVRAIAKASSEVSKL